MLVLYSQQQLQSAYSSHNLQEHTTETPLSPCSSKFSTIIISDKKLFYSQRRSQLHICRLWVYVVILHNEGLNPHPSPMSLGV
ncbi:hypothetical protein WN55_01263 [Dufourea novaeangliae]|uniref:Uncharacterized protein n=1 Tax=Dufourea novaeangliae TaxID=178035 RepID=A0A154NWR5_DUFNO|nr:hypothetical protein WN55_01263 [Dufourea novaeangliae]